MRRFGKRWHRCWFVDAVLSVGRRPVRICVRSADTRAAPFGACCSCPAISLASNTKRQTPSQPCGLIGFKALQLLAYRAAIWTLTIVGNRLRPRTCAGFVPSVRRTLRLTAPYEMRACCQRARCSGRLMARPPMLRCCGWGWMPCKKTVDGLCIVIYRAKCTVPNCRRRVPVSRSRAALRLAGSQGRDRKLRVKVPLAANSAVA